MLMRTEFIDLHYCTRCQISTEHIKFIYKDEGTITCQICQNTEDFAVSEGILIKKFTVASVNDRDMNSTQRRLLTAEIIVESIPDSMGEGNKPSYEDIIVEWPAYTDIHYTAQVELVAAPVSKALNYRDAQDISKAIKIFIGKEFP